MKLLLPLMLVLGILFMSYASQVDSRQENRFAEYYADRPERVKITEYQLPVYNEEWDLLEPRPMM